MLTSTRRLLWDSWLRKVEKLKLKNEVRERNEKIRDHPQKQQKTKKKSVRERENI